MPVTARTPSLTMEAKPVSTLPLGPVWRYEPKWDGFRCLARKDQGRVLLRSKSGKPLERYFPDIVEALEGLKAPHFILDGELVIEMAEGYSFSGLQLRLHPSANRVRKLADAQPASYILFDLLETADQKMTENPFSARRDELEKFYDRYASKSDRIGLSPQTKSLKTATGWFKSMAGKIDGLIAKDVTQPYQPGERVMQKYKIIRAADCVVGGFRYGSGQHYAGSLLLGLYDDDGLLHHVGFTSGIDRVDRPALTKKLEKLIAPPGFTGKSPGGPSRWSTERSGQWEPLKPELVAEIAYDHVSDHRFRHGTRFLRWRPDKSPHQCTFEQLRQPAAMPLQVK